MLEYILNHIGEITGMMTVIVTIVSVIMWSHRKLHGDILEIRADIVEIRKDIREAHDRIDSTFSRIDSMGTQIDAMGTRIAGLYNVMMAMLTKEKKG